MDLAEHMLEQAGGWMAEGERRQLAETARQDYLELTGRVNEDDECFERRMAAFLEYFLLDWEIPDRKPLTPIGLYLENAGDRHPSDERTVLAALACSHVSVFELLGLKHETAFMGDLLLGGQWEVRSEGSLLGVETGDVFEARLFCLGGVAFFTPAICHHPHEARHLVKLVVRKALAADTSPEDIAGRLSQMRLSFDRYPRMPLGQIYIP